MYTLEFIPGMNTKQEGRALSLFKQRLSYWSIFFGKTFVVIWPEAMHALGWQPFRPQRRTTVLKSL